MILVLADLGFVLAGSLALLRPGGRNAHGARLTAFIWSLALLLSLLLTWRVIVAAHRWVEEIGTPVDSAADVAALAAAHPVSFAASACRIPTRVFLQSFEVLNANNVAMTGYVWQTGGKDVPAGIARGVVFPEALADAYTATEAWRTTEPDGSEQIGWYFSGTFRQSFNYRLFPFDRQGIWLRLWSPDLDRPVLLVPDFAA